MATKDEEMKGNCKDGCGFFGDPNKEGLCSSCYRKAHPEIAPSKLSAPVDPTKCKNGYCTFAPSKDGYCSVCYKVKVLGMSEAAVLKPSYEPDRPREDDTPSGQLVKACRKGNLDEVRRLVETEGANVNHELQEGDGDNEVGIVGYNTPLGDACFYGHAHIVRYLLQQPKIDVNKRCYGCSFPLNVACVNHKEECILALLEHHARTRSIDLEHRGYGGWTPIESCCNEGVACQAPEVKALCRRMIRALVAAGARPVATRSDSYGPFLRHALEEEPKKLS